MQHRGGEDRHFHRDGRGRVVAANGADQHARRALALQVGVVVREVLHAEGHVGGGQELLVLVAVRIEGADDEGAAPDHRAHPPRDLGLGPGHAAHAHRAVQGEIDAVPCSAGLQFVDHAAEEDLERLCRDPAGAGTGLGPERRFDADQLDALVLARDLHETAHVRARLPGKQCLSSGWRALVDEVVIGGVVGQERHRFVGEVQDGDADGLAGHRERLPDSSHSGMWIAALMCLSPATMVKLMITSRDQELHLPRWTVAQAPI